MFLQHNRGSFRTSLTAGFAAAILAVPVAAAPPSAELPADIKTVRAGDVTAHFGGERRPDAPPRFGVQVLWFSFRGDGAVYRFKPGRRVSFWEWNLDIFSPDGKRVLLLQNRTGPYHVVRASRLRAYLRGRAKPDEIVGQIPKPSEMAAIHAPAFYDKARWLSATRFRYVVSCCGGRDIKTHRLRLAAGSAPAPDALIAYRPGLWNGLRAPSLGTDKPVDLARAYYEYSRRANRNRGHWEKGKVAQGANPKEYVPSDDELILAKIGDRLLEMVEKKGWGWADELRAAGFSLNNFDFTEFTFRHVDVMGTGRFYYVAGSRKVCVRRDDAPPLLPSCNH